MKILSKSCVMESLEMSFQKLFRIKAFRTQQFFEVFLEVFVVLKVLKIVKAF